MGRRGSVLTLVIINVIVTLVVAFGVMSVINQQTGSQSPNQIVITVPVLITTTPDANATPEVRIITATPRPGTPGVVALPTGILDGLDGTNIPIPTFDAELLSADSALQLTATALPENCILYTIKEGDTPYGIALEYGVSGEDLMAVNGLTDELAAFLQIGDVLIVPLEGCDKSALTPLVSAADATEAPTDTPEPTGTPATATPLPSTTPLPSATATATLPPTATNAQVEIVRVLNPGDINAEGVDVRNNGAVVDVTGWTLSDGAGHTYTFPQQRLFQGSLLTIYTRADTDTPTAKYWGLDTALWSSGSTLTLSDSNGRVQSTYRVP